MEEGKSLEIWKGLDFTGFQEGDSILIPEPAMHKMCYYGGGNWSWFHSRLRDVGDVLKLGALIEGEYDDELGDCYRISFVSVLPPTSPKPDEEASIARTRLKDAAISRRYKMMWDAEVKGFKEHDS